MEFCFEVKSALSSGRCAGPVSERDRQPAAESLPCDVLVTWEKLQICRFAVWSQPGFQSVKERLGFRTASCAPEHNS